MDVGQPKDFVIGSSLYLDHVSKTKPDLLCKNQSCLGELRNYICILESLEITFNTQLFSLGGLMLKVQSAFEAPYFEHIHTA